VTRSAATTTGSSCPRFAETKRVFRLCALAAACQRRGGRVIITR
jgi:hypothetical protein